MAIIYRFEDFLKELDTEEIERLAGLSEKEIAELEELLVEEYGDISLSEAESQEIYAKIMRQIMQINNQKRKNNTWLYKEK